MLLSIIEAVLSTLLNACRCLPLQLYWFWLFHLFLSAWRGQKEPPLPDGDVFSMVLKIHQHPNTPLFPVVCFVLPSGLWTNKQELPVTCMLV